MRGLRGNDVRTEPRPVHRWLLLLLLLGRGLLEGMLLVAGLLVHGWWLEVRLTEELGELSRRKHIAAGRRTRRAAVLHRVPEVRRSGVHREEFDLLREHTDRLFELADQRLQRVSTYQHTAGDARTSCPRSASLCQVNTSFLRFKISERTSRESSWCNAV